MRSRRLAHALAIAIAIVSAAAALAAANVAVAATSAEAAAHAVLDRVIGPAAAAQIALTLVPPTVGSDGTPVEEFTIGGTAGSIVIQATTSSALTQGAGWYLKYVAHADVFPRGRNPALPAVLPAPGAPIHQRASVPHRYAFNDTNDAYTDPNLPWDDWENQLDLIALHGINAIHLTVGTDAVYYQLMQRYGYAEDEVRRWIPDPAHQPWWVLQNMSGGDFAISPQLLAKRAALGRRIADRARELGITPVLPGYWGTVPADFAARNAGADVIAQDTWVGYQRPGWLNPTTPLFRQVATDYYAISAQVLGASTMYKMDPLHEGGVLGHVDFGQAGGEIERALQAARPGATWALIAWLGNPSPALLAGVADKSRVLILATESDKYPAWDGGAQWPGFPYALGSIYNFGGRTVLGANVRAIVDRWYADRAGPNAARLRGVAIFPESWSTNPAVAELMSELPWQPARIDVGDWMRSYAIGRYGAADPHALAAWSILADTIYATPPDGNDEAQDALFNAQPGLAVASVNCCIRERMRYSGPDLERAWRELLAASAGVAQGASYRYDLADLTRQVVVNRARVLLPLVRRAFDRGDAALLASLRARWMQLLDLADRVEGTDAAFLLGARLANARANASTPAEAAQLVRNAVNLVTNWGTKAGFDSGLRDYAHRDWNCLTSTYYKPRWALFFDDLAQQLAGGAPAALDWYAFGDAYASADHAACAVTPNGDTVEVAQAAVATLAGGPDASSIPDGWSSYAENEAVFGFDAAGYTIASAGADLWQNVDRFGALYRRGALRDGGVATVRVAALQSEGNRPWARAGIVAGGNLVASRPGGFVNIAITPAHGCVFSWSKSADAGLADYTAAVNVGAPAWLRLSRIGNTYVGSCSADGIAWTVVGSAVPDALADTADVGMFATAANAGGSDRVVARFDGWQLAQGAAAGNRQVAIEYFHAAFGHHFVTALTDEIAKLDAGVFDGWARTGQAFAVAAAPGPGLVPVCRFFTVAFPPTSSHFYAPRGLGCEGALANRDWQLEGDVFFSPIPDAGGGCPPGHVPIYRLYNNGRGGAPNHRFTTDVALRAQMLALGYVAEGTGIGVGMCSPQ